MRIIKSSVWLRRMTFDHARLWFSFTCIAEGRPSVPSLWKEFDEANIGTLLEQRYHSGKLRKAGIRTKGPKPFTEKDHMSFVKR